MKTFIAFMCLLAVSCVLTKNPEGLATLYRNMEQCSKEVKQCGNALIDRMTDVNMWVCALKKKGVIDENNKINRTLGIQYCDDVMTKEHVEYCKETVGWCLDTAGKKSEPDLDCYYETSCIIKQGVMACINKENENETEKNIKCRKHRCY